MQPTSPLRVYVTGDLAIEYGATVITPARLGTRQARVLFARLAIDRARTLPRRELADTIWPSDCPDAWDVALSAVASRLRAAFRQVGVPELGIDSEHGGYRLRLPSDAWLDIEAAAGAVDEAEGALRANRIADAWSGANVAVVVGRRGFLADEDGPWVAGQRARLGAILRRGLQCLSAASLRNQEPDLAVVHAEELIAVDPLLESSYRHALLVHGSLGNRAEALRVYARLRDLLRDELGTSPSPETEAVYLAILRA